ncbi:MAG TPA: TetR family transcriptional regulator [Solirubrobacteraceae bacterium]|nr:TetR family transcriptional regulator [Solirubrobacteraceae bacterium]
MSGTQARTGARKPGRRRGAGAGAAKPGRPDARSYGRDRVAEIQRARMTTAAVQLACERGAANMSIAHVVERAGVSRRTFYELFSDRDECFLAAFEEIVSEVEARVVPAYQAGGRWNERVRQGLVELLAFCERKPQLARVALVESSAGGPSVLARRVELLETLNAIVAEGRGEQVAKSGGSDEQSADAASVTAEGIVGGVVAVLSARLVSAGARKQVEETGFLGLAGPLMSMIVLPYLGAAAARREASRAVPEREAGPAQNLDAVRFHGLGIRLTYRTLMVLMAVAQCPGASNRAIGESAGMSDQGQTSKLLARLQRVGLVENRKGVAVKGAPNSWALTETGHRIAETFNAYGDTVYEGL